MCSLHPIIEFADDEAESFSSNSPDHLSPELFTTSQASEQQDLHFTLLPSEERQTQGVVILPAEISMRAEYTESEGVVQDLEFPVQLGVPTESTVLGSAFIDLENSEITVNGLPEVEIVLDSTMHNVRVIPEEVDTAAIQPEYITGAAQVPDDIEPAAFATPSDITFILPAFSFEPAFDQVPSEEEEFPLVSEVPSNPELVTAIIQLPAREQTSEPQTQVDAPVTQTITEFVPETIVEEVEEREIVEMVEIMTVPSREAFTKYVESREAKCHGEEGDGMQISEDFETASAEDMQKVYLVKTDMKGIKETVNEKEDSDNSCNIKEEVKSFGGDVYYVEVKKEDNTRNEESGGTSLDEVQIGIEKCLTKVPCDVFKLVQLLYAAG